MRMGLLGECLFIVMEAEPFKAAVRLEVANWELVPTGAGQGGGSLPYPLTSGTPWGPASPLQRSSGL